MNSDRKTNSSKNTPAGYAETQKGGVMKFISFWPRRITCSYFQLSIVALYLVFHLSYKTQYHPLHVLSNFDRNT